MNKLAALMLVLMGLFYGCGKDNGVNNELNNVQHFNEECPFDINDNYVQLEKDEDGNLVIIELRVSDNGNGTSTFSGYIEPATLVDGIVKTIKSDVGQGQSVAYCADGKLTVKMQGTVYGQPVGMTTEVLRTEDNLIELRESWYGMKGSDAESGAEVILLKEDTL